MNKKEKKEQEEENKNQAPSLTAEEIESLLANLKELEGMREQMLRTAADFENAKKRLQKEREDFTKFGQERLLRELLPVLDNFERALSHSDQLADAPQQVKSIVSGVQMVQKQLLDILKNQGLSRIETKDRLFDPHKHEAIAFVQEEGTEDAILDEIEAGYMLHDRLLRAAKVRVRIAPQTGSSPASPDGDKSEELT